MPVVINDFEVVPETPAPSPAPARSSGEQESARGEEKPDLQEQLRLMRERLARVRAH